MPAAHRAHRQWTPQRLIDWGLGIGASTGALIEQLLMRYKHPEHCYRSALGLLSLAKRHGRDRLEAACALALSLQACHYRTVRDILWPTGATVCRPCPRPTGTALTTNTYAARAPTIDREVTHASSNSRATASGF